MIFPLPATLPDGTGTLVLDETVLGKGLEERISRLGTETKQMNHYKMVPDGDGEQMALRPFPGIGEVIHGNDLRLVSPGGLTGISAVIRRRTPYSVPQDRTGQPPAMAVKLVP